MRPWERIEQRLDRIETRQAEQNQALAHYNASLDVHIRRTDTLEKRVDSIWVKALTALSLVGGAVSLFEHLLRLHS